MSDTSAAPVAETSRRRLLAWLGAGGAAALATLFTRESAKAGHDGTNTLHLGETNHNPPGSSTQLDGSGDEPTFSVLNDAGRGPALGVGGTAHFGANVADGSVVTVNNHDAGPGAAGLGVFVLGEQPAISGIVTGPGEGTGVRGESMSGTGGEFASESGYALRAEGRTHLGGNVDGFALGVDNEETTESAGGILAISRGGKPAIEGDALPNEHHGGIGVQGVSGFDETFGEGPGIGVQGISGTGVGVDAISADGLALRVQGRAGFSTVGSALVAAGAASAFVANEAVTEDSHIAVTFTADPGGRHVSWIERDPGNGFTVHLTPGPRRPIALTYSIVEPL